MVTVCFKSHGRTVAVLTPAAVVTSRVRAPLIDVSIVDAPYPPTDTFFFIWRSCASEAIASRTRVRIVAHSRKPRIGQLLEFGFLPEADEKLGVASRPRAHIPGENCSCYLCMRKPLQNLLTAGKK